MIPGVTIISLYPKKNKFQASSNHLYTVKIKLTHPTSWVTTWNCIRFTVLEERRQGSQRDSVPGWQEQQQQLNAGWRFDQAPAVGLAAPCGCDDDGRQPPLEAPPP
jgi:hypothetical protein